MRPDLVAVDNNVNPREYLGKFYVDSLTHDTEVLRTLIDLVGPDRIALGSDYPFPLGEKTPGAMIDGMGLTQEVKDWLMFESARQWLNIPTS